jgi:hypothetical protein
MRNLPAQIVRPVLGIGRSCPEFLGQAALLLDARIIRPDFAGEKIRFELPPVSHFPQLGGLRSIIGRLPRRILLWQGGSSLVDLLPRTASSCEQSDRDESCPCVHDR